MDYDIRTEITGTEQILNSAHLMQRAGFLDLCLLGIDKEKLRSWSDEHMSDDDLEIRKETEQLESECAAIGITADDVHESLSQLEGIQEMAGQYWCLKTFAAGVDLIHDDYLKEHVQLSAECQHGDMNQWPFCCIDWDKAVEAWKQDYKGLTLFGSTYWTRA